MTSLYGDWLLSEETVYAYELKKKRSSMQLPTSHKIWSKNELHIIPSHHTLHNNQERTTIITHHSTIQINKSRSHMYRKNVQATNHRVGERQNSCTNHHSYSHYTNITHAHYCHSSSHYTHNTKATKSSTLIWVTYISHRMAENSSGFMRSGMEELNSFRVEHRVHSTYCNDTLTAHAIPLAPNQTRAKSNAALKAKAKSRSSHVAG